MSTNSGAVVEAHDRLMSDATTAAASCLF